MTLSQIRQLCLEPAYLLLPAKMESPQATAILLAIHLQEDPDQRRKQWPKGPAHGLLQFELPGGVRGVLRHGATSIVARQVCEARNVAPTAEAVHAQLRHDDVLAFAFGRLLLWTDPAKLPALGEADRAWALYLRTWRPGKPRPEEWPANYARALAAVPR